MSYQQYLIASYPRSGSTWLRFILCNLLYPDIEHTFQTVNERIPGLEGETLRTAVFRPMFFKTHDLRHGQNIIFLHRHVGDVLISEWWFKKKFHADQRSFEEFLEACDYGWGWRDHVDFYFPCARTVQFCKLSDALELVRLLSGLGIPSTGIDIAMRKSEFARLQEIEQKSGTGGPDGDPEIKFIRDGSSGQWRKLTPELCLKILDKNFTQLKMLGYL